MINWNDCIIILGSFNQ